MAARPASVVPRTLASGALDVFGKSSRISRDFLGVCNMPEAKHLYEFGPFRLDPVERLLLRDKQPVSLPPKTFDTLLVLVENSGHLLTKDELLKRLWPGTFVEEANLAQNISAARRALDGANGGAQYIETVPKGGYRFVAETHRVARDAPSPSSPPARQPQTAPHAPLPETRKQSRAALSILPVAG